MKRNKVSLSWDYPRAIECNKNVLVKREKEALIWASSASGDRGAAKKRTQQIDKQSRNILGKTYKGQIKVLKGDEPLKLPNRQRDPDLQKVSQVQNHHSNEIPV